MANWINKDESDFFEIENSPMSGEFCPVFLDSIKLSIPVFTGMTNAKFAAWLR